MTIDYIKIAQMDVAERYPIIVYADPDLEDLEPGWIIGSWAYSKPGKMRYIRVKDLEIVPGVLPGDLTRAWLKDEYNLPIKRRKAQMDERSYKAPLYARKGLFGECGYVDIKAAYAHILQCGFNVEYRRGKYLSAEPRPLPEQIRRHKLCYSMAVSMSHSALSNITIMGHERPFTTHPFNTFSNPCLFNLAQDTLSGIAAELRETIGPHLFYHNTDGCIVDSDYIDKAQEIILSWGFSSKVKFYGNTEICGVGSYSVGLEDHITHEQRDPEYLNPQMNADEWRWLKRRWEKYFHLFLSSGDEYSRPIVQNGHKSPRERIKV